MRYRTFQEWADMNSAIWGHLSDVVRGLDMMLKRLWLAFAMAFILGMTVEFNVEIHPKQRTHQHC